MDVDEARAITSREAQALLASLPEYDASRALARTEGLRRLGADPLLAAAVMTQARLRAHARAKFGDFAEGMAFTEPGLEQATRLSVAARHAERFLAAGIERVADLTAGIGADAMAMSAMGIAVMAFEADEATAIVADYNLRHFPDSVVVCADSIATVRDVDVDGAFADPGRRDPAPTGVRRHRPEDYSPPLSAVLDLRNAYPALGVKVGPGIPRDAIPADAEAEWVSADGEVVEAAIWCGPLAGFHGRSALVLRPSGSTRLIGRGARAAIGPLREYLHEPDGAVIRAGLVAEFAEEITGTLVDPRIAYVTSDAPTRSAIGDAFRVVDDLPFAVKRLRAYLRERHVGTLEIKKRGTAVTPESLRPQLALKGDAAATVILTRVAGAQRAIIVERVP